MSLSKMQANLVLLFCALIWGISFTFIKIAANANLPIGLLNALRGLLLAVLLYLFFRKTIRKMTAKELRLGALGGLFYFAVTQLQSTGLKYTVPSNSAFLTATYVLFIPFASWLVFHQRPERKVYFSVALSLIGMLFLTGIFEKGLRLQLGDLLTILSAIFVAIQIVFLSHAVKEVHPIRMSFMMGSMLFVLGGGYSLLFERGGYQAIEWGQAAVPVIYLGVMASFVAQTLQIFSQKFTDATSAGVVMMTESLFASFFSVLTGFESVSHNLIIGGTLIFCSLLLMQLDFSRVTLHLPATRK